jgi:hypothetical protein
VQQPGSPSKQQRAKSKDTQQGQLAAAKPRKGKPQGKQPDLSTRPAAASAARGDTPKGEGKKNKRKSHHPPRKVPPHHTRRFTHPQFLSRTQRGLLRRFF